MEELKRFDNDGYICQSDNQDCKFYLRYEVDIKIEALEAKVKVAEDLIKKNKKYVQYYDHQRFNSSDAYDNWQEIEEYIKQIGSK